MLALLLILTLCGFAGNSVLCRYALEGQLIDPVSFTSIRILSGAGSLLLVSYFLRKKNSESLEPHSSGGHWKSAIALYLYAIMFSLAYRSLGSGTGALILFGVVQLVMLLAGFIKGERLSRLQWLSFGIAVTGFVYLLSPGISVPDLTGALLMGIAGGAWAYYTIMGKESQEPVLMTRENFLRACPMAIVVSLASLKLVSWTPQGLVVATLSGAITSGLAYTLWYLVLPKLKTSQAAILQLLVPLLATLGGVLFIGETFTARVAISTVFILGGVLLSVKGKSAHVSKSAKPT